MKPNEIQVPREKLVLANTEGRLHDKELVTKPISYFRDAWNRFKKNKASIGGAIVILILILYAVFAPIISPYSVSYSDKYYTYTAPKIFNNGKRAKDLNETSFSYYYGIGVETGANVVVDNEFERRITTNPYGKKIWMYEFKLDTYQQVGVVFLDATPKMYADIQAYQDEHNVQIIYPITDPSKRPSAIANDAEDANFWYETTTLDGKTITAGKANSEGVREYTNIYLPYSPDRDDPYTSKMRIEGDTPLYAYGQKQQGGYKIRVNYYEYYKYYHSEVLKDGIKEPFFIFGTTNSGQDIFTCLASGARFSFILAIVVASVNLVVGAIYGAIEGYYGGKIDILMERFVEILSAVPFMIVVTLLKYHMKSSPQVLILFISFFLTGWIGMAGRTRMQFYRFKNQEYVLAARTLGARDKRIMFKHIFPNSLGTLITSSVLVIPGMIFSETSLSYLGIINLNTGDMTSVGTLLANAQPYLVTYPHYILFPSIFICLLMLSFNLFGNGLRDAFNPSLRGAED